MKTKFREQQSNSFGIFSQSGTMSVRSSRACAAGARDRVSAASRSACRWSYWSAERALPALLDIYPAQWRRYINLNDVKGYIQLFLLCGLDKDTGIWQGSK